MDIIFVIFLIWWWRTNKSKKVVESTPPSTPKIDLKYLSDQEILDRKCHEYLTTRHW